MLCNRYSVAYMPGVQTFTEIVTAMDYGCDVVKLFPASAVGIGFMLTMTVYAKLHNAIDEEAVPAPFRGLPIDLLTAGMIVLALLALNFKI